ncbi:hypothetical protein OU545_07115, partial [Escherichia coli]|nr:hypothetical protein [Escherichia coli]
MLWTENDAENTSQWNGYPLQIGRFRKDKAMPALISGEKSTALVTPPQWRNKAFNGLKDPERNYWAKEQITGSPEENIKAAITYLMMKLSKEGANKRGNSSRLTQSFHFFMFEPIF